MKAGMPQEQAEAVCDTFREATAELEPATKGDLRELEQRLIIKLGTMMVVAVTVVATLVKIL